jgi:hypothetical protein
VVNRLESIVRFLVFQLQTLGDRNGHHEFEHLCRRVAAARIASNLLPATGPVSAGGDAGRDFETHPAEIGAAVDVVAAPASWAARTTSKRLAFCCTIQQQGLRAKLVEDAAKIMRHEPHPDRIHSFVCSSFPIGERRRTIEEVRDELGVELVIHDALYLAEQLAQPDLFWVAERYLDAPQEMAPPADGAILPEWYREAKRVWSRRDPLALETDVLELTDALRFAASSLHARADVPFWVAYMQRLIEDPHDHAVQQRARYEIVYATFLVEGTLIPVDDTVRAFFAGTLDDHPETLRNAALLLQSLALTVYARQTTIPAEQVSEWADRLRVRVAELLGDEPEPSNWRSMLLHVFAHLHMHLRLDLTPAEAPQRVQIPLEIGTDLSAFPAQSELAELLFDVDQAVESWLTLVRGLDDFKQFPVNHLSGYVARFTPMLIDHPQWGELNRLLDAGVVRNGGATVAGERRFLRGRMLFDQQRYVDALREFHGARDHFFEAGEPRESMMALIFAAYSYDRLGLHLAAELHALNAALLGTRSTDLNVRDLVGSALAVAALAEYRRGAWVGAVELIAWTVGSEFFFGKSMREELGTHIQAVLDAALTIAASALALLGENDARVLTEHLTAVRVGETLGVDLDEIARQGARLTPQEWDEKFAEHFDAPPAQDLSESYEVAFTAFGSRWEFRAADPRDRVCVRACERLAAAAQVLVLELSSEHVSLVPSHFTVVVFANVANAGRVAHRALSQTRWSWQVVLSPLFDVDSNADGSGAVIAEMLSVLSWILGESAIAPTRQAIRMIQELIDTRFILRFDKSFPYDRLRGPFEDPELRNALLQARRATRS